MAMLNNQRVQMKCIIPSITQLYVEKNVKRSQKTIHGSWPFHIPYMVAPRKIHKFVYIILYPHLSIVIMFDTEKQCIL